MRAQLAPPDHGWQRLRWECGPRYYEAWLHQDFKINQNGTAIGGVQAGWHDNQYLLMCETT